MKPVTSAQKLHFLSTFGILRSAVEIPCRFHSFLAYIFLTSLPLLSTMLAPRLLAWPYFADKPQVNLQLSPPNKLMYASRLALDVATSILRAILIDQVNFLTAVSTIYSASKTYTTTGKSTRLQDLLQKFMKTKWNATLIAFLYMSL